MAKQKRLNKNMVAFLTLMGMLLVIGVAALIIRQGARRDPAALALQAREIEQLNDVEKMSKAVVLYRQAYAASEERDPNYVFDSARCFFKMAAIGPWLETLSRAHSKDPHDPRPIVAVLNGLWRLREMEGVLRSPNEWRDWSDKLLQIEPNHPLGLVCRARALAPATEETSRAAAAEAARQAYGAGSTDPRVVVVYAEYREREQMAAARAAAQAGSTEAVLEQQRMKLNEEIKGIFDQAVGAEPNDPGLIMAYADHLDGMCNWLRALARRPGREAEAAAWREQAQQLRADAIARLDRVLRATEQTLKDTKEALTAKPAPPIERARELWETQANTEWYLPELYLALAQQTLKQGVESNEQLTAADDQLTEEQWKARRAAEQALVARVDPLLERAIALDPAMYDAYTARAQVRLVGVEDAGESRNREADRLKHAVAALTLYEEASRATQTLRTLRATLTEAQRMLMLLRGFLMALDCRALAIAQKDTDRDAAALASAKQFLEDAQVKAPEYPATLYMEGQYAIATNDLVTAIKAFQKASETSMHPIWWLQVARVTALPEEQLAALYLQARQFGEAEQWARQALARYEKDVGQNAPVPLILVLAQVVHQLNRLPEAYQLLDQARLAYPGDARLAALRAQLLAQEGRGEEATKAAREAVTAATPQARLWQAQVALQAKDLATAEQLTRGLLESTDTSDELFESALQLLLNALEDGGRRAEAQQLVRELKQKGARPKLAMNLERYEVLLSETDPQQRDAKLLEIIARVADPATRAEQYVGFYLIRSAVDPAVPGATDVALKNMGEALKYLRELRKLRGAQPALVEREFELRLRIGQAHDEAARVAERAGAASRVTAEQTAAKEALAQAGELAKELAQVDDGKGWDRVGGASYRGKLALVQDNAEVAIREYRQAVQGSPKSAELQVGLARAYRAAGRQAEAIDALKRAVAFNPNDAEAHGLLSVTYDDLAAKATGPERNELQAQANAAFEVLARLSPNNPYVAQRRARQEEEAKPLEAIAAREPKCTTDPNDLANIFRVGELYVRAAQITKDAGNAAALPALTTRGQAFYAAQLGTSDPNLRLRLLELAANFYALQDDRAGGEAFVRKFFEQATGDQKVLAQLMLARIAERFGDTEAAEREFVAAQGLINPSVSDPAKRRELALQIGLQFVDFYGRSGRARQVIEVCRWLLDRVAEQGDAVQRVRLKLIDALLQAGQVTEADQETAEYVKAYGEDQDGLMARARVRLAQNERDAATADLTAILKESPDHVWALMARGWLMLQRARYDAARVDLERAAQLTTADSPWAPRLRGMIAALHERAGRLEAAVEEIRKELEALARGGARPEVQAGVVADLVRVLRKINQIDKARDLVSEYMAKSPEDPLWPQQLGLLYEMRADGARKRGDAGTAEKDYASAARYYQRTAELCGEKQPGGRVQALTAQLLVLVKAGKARDALQLFKAQPQEKTPVPLRLAAARAYAQLNDSDAALEQWRIALQDASTSSMGQVGTVTNDVREVVGEENTERLLRALVEPLPADVLPGQRLRIALGDALGRCKRGPEAITLLNQTLETLPKEGNETLAALLTRGQIQEQSQDNAAAIASYQQVLELAPQHLAALNNLAYLLVDATGPGLPRPEEALKYAERLEGLVQENPNAANMLDTIGWVYFRYGNSRDDRRAYLERAGAALEQALSLDDETLPAIEHLGLVYAAGGRDADARALLNRGRDLAKKAGNAEYVQKFEAALQKLP
jgi:tetratricopeptide (TPR) repeat protein